MSESSVTDAISPETVPSPAQLAPGDEVYCSIPMLGWVRGRIAAEPATRLPPVQQNGTSYQLVDFSHAPIVSLWAPKSILSAERPDGSPPLIEQSEACTPRTRDGGITDGAAKDDKQKKGHQTMKGKKSQSMKKLVKLPNKLNSKRSGTVAKSTSLKQTAEPRPVSDKSATSPNSSRFKYDFYSQSESLFSRGDDITLQYQTFEFPMPKKTLPFAIPSQKLGLCFKCGDIDSDVIMCVGSCQRSFHPKCFKSLFRSPSTGENPTKCPECSRGETLCTKCHFSLDGVTVQCSVKNCSSILHKQCADEGIGYNGNSDVAALKNGNAEPKKFRCPRHVCLTCVYAEEHTYRCAPHVSCVRCLSTYHNKHACLPSGCELLSGQSMICYKHCSKTIAASVLNVNWCFECGAAGTLICCETCPAAFHQSCIDKSHPVVADSEKKWYCRDCYHCHKPTAGSIVWAKHGNHRWWPAQICGEYDTPENMQITEHSIGEFVVHFFGTENYGWVHHGRVYPFLKEDKCIYSKSQKGLNVKFRTAIQDAKTALSLHDDGEMLQNNKTSNKYIQIKNNRYLTSRPPCVLADACNCTEESPCVSDSKCINRMMKTECSKETCPVAELCGNMRLQKSEEVASTPFWTDTRGWGLKAEQKVSQDQFVAEYKGEMISYPMCLDRIRSAQEKGLTNFYMLTIDKVLIVDACFRGNNSRFMNHSCDPNCRTEKRIINGETRIGLFANRDISSGEELTFDYQLDCLGNDRLACKCGSSNCSGYIGLRPLPTLAQSENGNGANKGNKRKAAPKGNSSRRRKRNKTQSHLHDDDCFVCQDGGILIMCDFCPKAYHLECVERTELPRGQWKCPWHFCNVCGGNSNIQCQICPNSYCPNHLDLNFRIESNKFFCKEHSKVDISNYYLVHAERELESECVDVKPILVGSNLLA